MLFDSWEGLVQVALSGMLAYPLVIVLLRASGKRSLSKMNAFDFVITVALGSVMASVTLSKDVPVAEGVAAFAVLLGMQYLITWLSVRVPAVRQMIKSEPALLVHQGAFMDQAMKRERVTESEVLSAVRAQGIQSMASVFAVILETDGSLAVVPRSDGGPPTAMTSVANFPPPDA